MVNKIYNRKGFQIALPWLILSLGFISFAYGTYGTFDNTKNQDFYKTIGHTAITGGVFAVLLKSMQFIGVFREELIKIIFEPKTLENRVDLPIFWKNTSTVLFKNKFPRISDRLLKDVEGIYFPTKEVTYYENAEHLLEFVIENEEEGIVKVKSTITLDVVCEKSDSKTNYEFGFLKTNENYNLKKLKINGLDIDISNKSTEMKNGQEFYVYNNKLKGQKRHKIEKIFERKMKLSEDNIFLFTAKKIFFKLKVQIHYDKKLELKLRKSGTLNEFNQKKKLARFIEYQCEGLLYPEQGYFISVKKI
jgi:hypothetical protein